MHQQNTGSLLFCFFSVLPLVVPEPPRLLPFALDLPLQKEKRPKKKKPESRMYARIYYGRYTTLYVASFSGISTFWIPPSRFRKLGFGGIPVLVLPLRVSVSACGNYVSSA
ncbi:hypothetical protein ACLOJK_024925 [Asimina triloba]